MATVTERLAFLVSLDADQAVKGFEKVGSSADQNLSKMQRGSQAVFNTVKAHALEFAAAGGAALLGFAVKGVNAFQDLALSAGKFSDATGVGVEDASRWIEVAGDIGISTEAVQGSIMKMNKAIADGKLDEFGDSIVRASDGTIDANATFQNLVTTIGGIEDPTKRALAAQTAFGRGYGEIAELMNMSATDLAAALGSVSDAKVIDDKELKKARDFRAAMDELGDKVGDAALKIGGVLVPALITVAEKIETISEKASDVDQLGSKLGGGSGLAGKVRGALDQVVGLDNAMSGLSRIFDDNSSAAERLGGAVEFVVGGVPVLGEAVSDLNDNELELAGVAEMVAAKLRAQKQPYLDMQAAMRGANSGATEFDASLVDMGDAAADTKRKIEALKSGVDILTGALSKREAFETYKRSQNEVIWYAAAAAAALEDQTASEEDKQAAQSRADEAVRDSIDATLAYIDTIGGIPKSKATQIAALIDQGRYAEVQQQLDELARRRTVIVETIGKFLGREKRAAGGPVSAGRSYLVGEQGPELVTFGANGFVTPNHALSGPNLRADLSGAGGGSARPIYLTVNAGIGMDSTQVGRQLIEFITEAERTGGTHWRTR